MKTEKQRQLVELLKELEAGYLPFDVFIEIARLATLSIIEFVPLRIKNGRVEVLLLSRGDDDSIWPGELHTPGTVIRPTDAEEKMFEAFNRILKDELSGTKTSQPHFVGSMLHKSKRGTEHAQIYWLEVLEEPKTGKFYPADELPVNVMDSQKNFISLAAKGFKTDSRPRQ